MAPVWLSALVAASMAVQDAAQLRTRVEELNQQAQQALAHNDHMAYRRLAGEAWYTSGLLYDVLGREAQGTGNAAQAQDYQRRSADARRMAASLGYAPVAPHVHAPRAPAPGMRPPPPPIRPPGQVFSLWEYVRSEPWANLRQNSLISLVQVPPFEGAKLIPPLHVRVRTTLELGSSSFSDTTQGGPSTINGRRMDFTSQADVGITRWLQVGARFAMGQLRASDANRMMIFQGGSQIVHRGSRSFNPYMGSLRAKLAWPLTPNVAIGALLEGKIPFWASRYDYLTSQTFDLSGSLLLTLDFGPFAFNAAGGIVYPLGTPRMFRSTTVGLASSVAGASWLWHYGAGASLMVLPELTLGVQIEGNSSPWTNVTLLNTTVHMVSGYARARLTRHLHLGLGGGVGLTDLSNDYNIGLGLDIVW